MNVYSMKNLIIALISHSLVGCVVDYTPAAYYDSANRYHYSTHSCYVYRRTPTITPVGHGFDPDPQYINGYVYRGRDGMLYASEF